MSPPLGINKLKIIIIIMYGKMKLQAILVKLYGRGLLILELDVLEMKKINYLLSPIIIHAVI